MRGSANRSPSHRPISRSSPTRVVAARLLTSGPVLAVFFSIVLSCNVGVSSVTHLLPVIGWSTPLAGAHTSRAIVLKRGSAGLDLEPEGLVPSGRLPSPEELPGELKGTPSNVHAAWCHGYGKFKNVSNQRGTHINILSSLLLPRKDVPVYRFSFKFLPEQDPQTREHGSSIAKRTQRRAEQTTQAVRPISITHGHLGARTRAGGGCQTPEQCPRRLIRLRDDRNQASAQ